MVKKVIHDLENKYFNRLFEFLLGLKAGAGGGGGGGGGGQQFYHPNVDPHQTFRMFFVRNHFFNFSTIEFFEII
jgi:hypothetical protein